MFDTTMERREFVKVASAVAVGGTALAGCAGGGGGDGGGDAGGDGGDGSGGGKRSFGGWMEGVGNYDGVVDETGSDQVAVMVGTEANGGSFGFGPPAIEVSSGTTVVWEWTGKGGQHNVVHDGGDFESELTDEEGFTFEHAFEEAGTYKYFCEPHETVGMKGVVVVS